MSVEGWLVISVAGLVVGAWLHAGLIGRLEKRVERIERLVKKAADER